MRFKYSYEASAATYPTRGLAGDIPVRRHHTPFREDIGAIRAQQDWKKFATYIPDFKGGLSDRCSLIQVTMPECIPERLEVVSYASEMGFLYDDCTEVLSKDELDRANDKMQSAFAECIRTGNIASQSAGLSAMQFALFREMVAIDEPRAMTAMKVWIEFLQKAGGRQHSVLHTSFENYLQYRVLDAGEMFWFGLLTFGMALTISDDEIPLVRELTRPCWVVLALQNDICSYEKEVEDARLRGDCNMINALWVLVNQEEMSLAMAQSFCRARISKCIGEYHAMLASCKHDDRLSEDAKTYMEALLYTMSGDAAWSLLTPRYNRHLKYNELQMSMMNDGIDVALERLQGQVLEPSIPATKKFAETQSPPDLTPERLAYERYTAMAK